MPRMYDGGSMQPFRFWCQKVLPLVYDDSLSYYELLCKVVEYINGLIEQDKLFAADIEELQAIVAELKRFVNEFDTSFAEEVIRDSIATMIFVGITDSGYIVYDIPEEWEDITFNTTGLDIDLALQPNYGHLVLSY